LADLVHPHTAVSIDTVNDLVLSQEGASGTHKTTHHIAKKTGIWWRSVGPILRRHSAKVPEETLHAGESWSNRASLIKQMISGEIVLMQVSKPNKNTLNICCDVFVHNCQFVMTFNTCGYEQTDRCSVSQGSVMTFIRRGG